MDDPAITMVDLEGRLASDHDGALRDQLCNELAAERAGVERYINTGLPLAEYEQASRWAAALDAAATVARKYWELKHPTIQPG